MKEDGDEMTFVGNWRQTNKDRLIDHWKKNCFSHKKHFFLSLLWVLDKKRRPTPLITSHCVVWDPLTHTTSDTCVMVWMNAPRHVAHVHPRVCFKQVWQQRVWLLYVTIGRRAEPICKMPPSTSLLSADTTGPQRFPVKLSSLYVWEQEPAERRSRGVGCLKP